jgi:dephospho-CoA kinase
VTGLQLTPRSGGRTIRIGITGPIGCGKSTVASWLGELGAVVVDADEASREVTEPGTPALEAIADVFGSGVVRDDGSLDRGALGQIVFGDAAALARLEAIVHPAVRPVILARMAEAERAAASAVVVEAIKLVEGGLASLCDEVWLVDCAPGVQLERLLARAAARALPRADTEARIAAQSGLADRLRPHATRVIDTSGTLDDTRRAVLDAWAAALAGLPTQERR